MKNKKVLVLGYFGYNTGQIDGQTVKTRSLYELLKDRVNPKSTSVSYFDTQNLGVSKLSYFSLLVALLRCRHLVYLPGKRSLVRLEALLRVLIALKKVQVYYFVVGGWLSCFLDENPRFVSLIRRFKYVGVEIPALKEELVVNYGFDNVDFFPNFRIHSFVPLICDPAKPLKLVYMARITEEKGIDLLFEAAKAIEEERLGVKITFYGPVAKKDEKYFYDQVQRFEFVDYKGVLNPKDINFVLSEYDALVLLTRYEGEGFPGSILDAYISGIPVLVTDWLFLPEFVDEGETGFVVKDVDQFIEKVKLLVNDKVLLKAMKQNAVAKSQEFSAEKAWSKIEGFFPEQDRCVVSK